MASLLRRPGSRWLWPLALILLACAAFIVFLAYQSPVAPFIYALF